MLYFDPRLAESHAISCNSCHIVGLGGVDVEETSIGHRRQRGGRSAPTALNAVFNTAQFRDGRAEDLKAQADGPPVNPIEMGTTENHVVEQLNGIPGYVNKFKKAFGGEQGPITCQNVRNAIALFEAALITPNAPFDRYLSGDEQAMTAQQKEGQRLFIDKGCASCHMGINVGGSMYAPLRRGGEARRRYPAGHRYGPFLKSPGQSTISTCSKSPPCATSRLHRLIFTAASPGTYARQLR